MRRLINLVETNLSEDMTPRSDQAFVSWFAGSKVVDAEGRPLILYHGTGDDIVAFDSKKMVWGSASPTLAGQYAAMRGEWHNGSPNLVPIYMKLVQPLDADALEYGELKVPVFFKALITQASSYRAISGPEMEKLDKLKHIVWNGGRTEESGPYYSPENFWYGTGSMFGADGSFALKEAFRILGFDGIKFTENGEMTYGAFSPSQVKFALSESDSRGVQRD